MNKARRKALDGVMEEIGAVHRKIGDLKEEEENYLDNMPDAIQDGNKGDAVQNCIDDMQEARDLLDEAMDRLRDAITGRRP